MFEKKDEKQLAIELKELQRHPMPSLKNLQQMISEASEKLDSITAPTIVMQGLLDDTLYKESAPIIYHNMGTVVKRLKWYEQSGHIITLGKEREQVYEDFSIFLNPLNW